VALHSLRGSDFSSNPHSVPSIPNDELGAEPLQEHSFLAFELCRSIVFFKFCSTSNQENSGNWPEDEGLPSSYSKEKILESAQGVKNYNDTDEVYRRTPKTAQPDKQQK
jgi:hypothetical protein